MQKPRGQKAKQKPVVETEWAGRGSSSPQGWEGKGELRGCQAEEPRKEPRLSAGTTKELPQEGGKAEAE